jgi:hypothetical protein
LREGGRIAIEPGLGEAKKKEEERLKEVRT